MVNVLLLCSLYCGIETFDSIRNECESHSHSLHRLPSHVTSQVSSIIQSLYPFPTANHADEPPTPDEWRLCPMSAVTVAGTQRVFNSFHAQLLSSHVSYHLHVRLLLCRFRIIPVSFMYAEKSSSRGAVLITSLMCHVNNPLSHHPLMVLLLLPHLISFPPSPKKATQPYITTLPLTSCATTSSPTTSIQFPYHPPIHIALPSEA